VCFGQEPGKLYFHCAKEGRKLDVLRANPRVCFQTDVDAEVVVGGNACQCTVKYRSVVGFGTARIVEDPQELRHGLDVLMRQYTEGPQEYPEKSLSRTAVVRIDIEEMTGKQSPAPKG
jgi:nitroimidazol reductase NimA-like FMN-containing flavoprotein (pyridoxamine 5'-phosphate oxidase superfamily)